MLQEKKCFFLIHTNTILILVHTHTRKIFSRFKLRNAIEIYLRKLTCNDLRWIARLPLVYNTVQYMDTLRENDLAGYHQHQERHTKRQLQQQLLQMLTRDLLRPVRLPGSVTMIKYTIR